MNKYDDFVIDRSTPEEKKLMKYIERHGQTRGWVVRFNSKKLKTHAYFGDEKHGGTWLALSEAISYRDKMLRRIKNKEKRIVKAAQAIVMAQKAKAESQVVEAAVAAPDSNVKKFKGQNRKRILSDKDVRDIRSSDLKSSELAEIFGVSYNHIRQILRGDRRQDVK